MNKRYELRYLPLFQQDLLEIVDYISHVLKNPEAASQLINEVEKAILKRLQNPLAYEAYKSSKKRNYPYYRIYVKNYIIFYVIIDNIMEVRRIMYHKRNYFQIL